MGRRPFGLGVLQSVRLRFGAPPCRQCRRPMLPPAGDAAPAAPPAGWSYGSFGRPESGHTDL